MLCDLAVTQIYTNWRDSQFECILIGENCIAMSETAS